MDKSFWENIPLIQTDVPELFEANGIVLISQFQNLDDEDLNILGIKYHSDKKRLMDKQKEIRASMNNNGPGGGNRTDLGGLEDDWAKIEQWRKNKAPFQRKGTLQKQRKKEFHISKMCFSKQKNLQIEKGQIPLKISCEPTLAEVKLAAFNAFEELKLTYLPDDVVISITDNTKKKMIYKIRNDLQLEKVNCIGYLCQAKEKENHDSESEESTSRVSLKREHRKEDSIFNSGGNHECNCSFCAHLPWCCRVSNCSELSKVQSKKKNSSQTPLWNKGCYVDEPLYCSPSKQVNKSTNVVKKQANDIQVIKSMDSSGKKSKDYVTQDEEVSFKKPDLATVDIQEEDLTLKEVIGKGQFGKVYAGFWKGSLQVAVKEIPKGYGEPDLSEIEICRRLKHPNITLLLGWVVTDSDILIVMNYVKGITLGVAVGLMKTKKEVEILEPKYNGFVIYKIGQGMAYLHEKGVIHQDLKPANVMVEERSKNPVICDFGVSKLKDNLATTMTAVSNAGTLAYQHKEQLEGKRPTTAVDVYAFGVVMGEVFTRKRAWEGMNGADVRNAILNEQFPDFSEVSSECKEIIDSCFQEPSKRPSFFELLPKLEDICEVDIW